jgi:hypothetical protein
VKEMVAILDDVLALILPSGIIPYAGLILGGFVIYWIIDIVKKALKQ